MPNDENTPRRGLLAGLLVLVLLGVVGLNRWFGPHEVGADNGGMSPESGEQEIDPALGVTLSNQIEGSPRATVTLAHQPGMTVLDLLQDSARQSDEWWFRYRGRGAGALLTELAGLADEGAGGRNWQYEVNGERAEVSMGVFELSPGDRVLWKFGPSE